MRLPTIQFQSIHKSERVSLVLVLQPRIQGGESSSNNWLTNVALIWRKAGESHPRIPSPVDCGWEFDTTIHHYAPVRCLTPPAPAAVMNLVNCESKRGCKRTCSSRNNNLPCTEVCGCVNFSCHNLIKSDDLALVMRDMDGDE